MVSKVSCLVSERSGLGLVSTFYSKPQSRNVNVSSRGRDSNSTIHHIMLSYMLICSLASIFFYL